MKLKNTTLLCILDGYGLRNENSDNAINIAKKPNLDKIFKEYNMVPGKASGLDVGLPDKQMGNSEVGHLNIGAGRIVYQDLSRINNDIKSGEFYKNEALLKAINHVKKEGSSLHIMGLLSDGGVHTHNTHLYAILELAKREDIKNVYVHCFMDGRDTAPTSGKEFLSELSDKIKKIGVGKIATICGRYYAMDRDKNYDRNKLAYDLLTKAEGQKYDSWKDAIEKSYSDGVTDEFVKPSVITGDVIKDNDSIIIFNFRPDRGRQITRCFVDDDFNFFERTKLKNIVYVTMTEYDPTIKNKLVAFGEKEIKNHIGEVVANNGLTQLRTAETEKYAHVTFFFNGGKEAPCKNEERILVPSPKEVPTYDLKPEMSANQVCENVIDAVNSDKYDFIVVNFANADMVGHTGKIDAAIKAIETIDTCIGKIYDVVIKKNASMMIIADHGNAECMKDSKGNPHTSHTNNEVPFCLITADKKKLKEGGRLCDVAPTLLKLMGIEKPVEMTGVSLI